MKKTLIYLALLLTYSITQSAEPSAVLDKIPHAVKELSAGEQVLQIINPLYTDQINQLRRARRRRKALPNRQEIQIKGLFLRIMIDYLSPHLYTFSLANLPWLLSHAKDALVKQNGLNKEKVYKTLEPLLQEIMTQFPLTPTST